MPRKVNYGVDYDDNYDDYEDYDDDDYDVHDIAPEPKQENNRSRLWRCSICTYDNDESMSACDICGIIRNPTAGNYKNCDNRTASSMRKDSEVSIMAKSLFASLLHQTPQGAIIGQQQNGAFVVEGVNDFCKHGNFQGNFREFHKVCSSHSHSYVNIDAFKFDVPSPDDCVSNGLGSSQLKAKFLSFKPSRVSAGATENNVAVNEQSTVRRSDGSSLLLPKGKQGNKDETNCSTNGAFHLQSNSKNADSSVLPILKNGLNGMDQSNYLKNGEPYIQSSDEISDHLSSLMPKGKHKIVDDSSSSTDEGKPYSLTGNLNDTSLSKVSGNPNNVKARTVKSNAQYQPEQWMLPDKTADTLSQLNLAIVGHVDSGKSTLSGRLLHLLGRITQKEMHKYEKEAKLQGKGSFAYAWALDESPEERERGITMTVAVAYFDSKKYQVVLLDSPGHKDFVPNMISGATQADAAILVIDASIGAFEAGMDNSKGQTREHAQLIRSFGVDQIIVAVNKMDSVEYSKERFDLIKMQLGSFLRSCNFKDSCVSWIPLSVMQNQNLVAAPSDVHFSSWYCGPNLLDAIDSLQPPTRDFSKPLCMPICDIIKSASLGQVLACGKLEAGALRSGLKVLVMPSGDVGTVRSLERDSQACAVARAGDNVAVSLMGIDGSSLMAGGVLCHPDFPVSVAKHLELRVLILELLTPVVIGSDLEFHIHHSQEAARVVRIVSLLDPKTKKVTKKAPRCLASKQSAVVEVVLNQPVCVEEFSSCRALGRVFLRASGRTIALGIVTRIIEDQD